MALRSAIGVGLRVCEAVRGNRLHSVAYEHGFDKAQQCSEDDAYHTVRVANSITSVMIEGAYTSTGAVGVVIVGMDALLARHMLSRAGADSALVQVQKRTKEVRLWDEITPRTNVRRWFAKAHWIRDGDGRTTSVAVGGVTSKAAAMYAVFRMVETQQEIRR